MSSRFGSTDYNAQGGSTSSEDFEERDGLLLGRYAIISAEIAGVGVNDQYGKSIVLNLDDSTVHEGVIADRQGADKKKVYGWSKWFSRDPETNDLVPFEEGGDISTDQLGRIVTEEAGGTTYKYTIEDGVMEGRDDPVDIGARDYWMGNSKKSRTFAKVLSAKGHDIVDEDNKRDEYEWLNAETGDEFQLREELEGQRIMFWFQNEQITVEEDGEEEQIEFTDAVILDSQTEAGITIQNAQEDTTAAPEASESDEPGVDAGEPEDVDEGFPDELESVINMFARTHQTDPDKVGNIIREEAPDDYTLDMDRVIAEIRQRED